MMQVEEETPTLTMLEDEDIGMTSTTTTADGTTIWNCRPYIGYTNLERSSTRKLILGHGISGILVRHDEDSSVQEPDAHSDKGLVYAATQIYTSRLEINVTQIQEAVYRYFTMKMTDHETPLQFFYRLNAAAVKAEVKFKSSSKLRESHIRRFVNKPRNDQLKTALEGHRFQSITDLERALRHHRDVWHEEGHDSPAPKKPSISVSTTFTKAGLRIVDRLDGRAFMTQGDAEPTQDSEFQHESQNPEVFADQAEAYSNSISELPNGGMDGEVYRIAECQHWKSPNPYPGQGVARPDNWDVFCEKCKKWGHPEVNGWTEMTMTSQGTPDKSLYQNPLCRMWRFSLWNIWKAFPSVMTLGKQGNTSELPTQFRSLLPTKDHASGAQQLNQ
ncbi:LOW QUALITY PROTEIN: hypothetical protein PHMEG_00032003 [Phytophthora megakarya]|uniref:Uncharacterized protein n=1 Tax=Phytophthora megakarya TaxID=4795 RepID=A0A225UY63_9STRA|nr:LOW QUALITY PROTEIN: hypothetical protein PHMEG_00032003 [Phytophthora megakarya]